MGSSFDLFDSPKVDRSISTSTIPRGNAGEASSDETTVRNAISSVDLDRLGKRPLPWANASTGSAGVVTGIREEITNGVTCRRFETTRHSYQGIGNFSGRACLVGEANWQLINFAPQS